MPAQVREVVEPVRGLAAQVREVLEPVRELAAQGPETAVQAAGRRKSPQRPFRSTDNRYCTLSTA